MQFAPHADAPHDVEGRSERPRARRLNLRALISNAYLQAFLAVLIAFAIQEVLGPHFGPVFSFVPFYFAALIAAWLGGIGPTLFAMTLGYILAADFFLNPGSIVVYGKDNLAALTIYLLMCLSTGLMAESLHRSRRDAEKMQQRLRLVLREMPICLNAFDREGNVIVWNRECERVTGFAASEILGNPHALELLYPNPTYRQRMIEEWRTNGKSYRNWEWQIANRDGTSRTIAWSNISDRFPVPGWASWGVGVDVTQHKIAEDTLRASEQRFRTMADSAPVMIWLCDAEMRCTWFNKPWLDFTGRTLQDELGAGWYEGVHPDDVERLMGAFTDAFEARRSFKIEFRVRRHDGQYRWVLDQALPLASPGGGFAGYVGSCIDIHEKIEAEEALREDDRRKNDFLAMLAHELRNPLATIQYANYISRIPAIEAQSPDYTTMIDDQVKHLARLIDDLLDVSRITRDKIELQKRRIDAAEVIRRAIEAARPLIESRQHRLEVEVSEEPIPVLADATRVEQVVQNLLNNAAKYTPEGGRITIVARPDDGEMLLSVKDNGAGMPRELIPKVFELFAQGERTLDRSEGGLGIGLTLVRKLVEMHGGSVAARSEGLGRGSEFIVRLPMVRATAPPPETGRREPVRALNSLRILVVEDNRESARGIEMLLRHAGHKIELCYEGTAAVGAARTYDPEVVLLDIGLPGMDGYEVARRMRDDDSLKHVTIVGLSGYGQQRDRDEAQRSGFDHHLVKPVDFQTLLTVLNRVEPRVESTRTVAG